MIGRGACGRPWLAAAVDRALRENAAALEPSLPARLDIVLDHLRDTLCFYGDKIGLKIFRKHLAWYVEQAPSPQSAAARREAKSRLCQITVPRDVETELTALWATQTEQA